MNGRVGCSASGGSGTGLCENGELKWSFQTGAGANSTVTVFEKNGKEQIVFLAGGNALATSPHGGGGMPAFKGTLTARRSAT